MMSATPTERALLAADALSESVHAFLRAGSETPELYESLHRAVADYTAARKRLADEPAGKP